MIINLYSFYAIRKRIALILFFILISFPYLIHHSQDLHLLVCHDEAAFHLNAKEIILFGVDSLRNNRLQYILYPFQTLFGLISFSLFDISLASLRLPYIVFNIIANILFFYFIMKNTNKLIAVLTTALFALNPLRFTIGKSGMSEALILPVVVILMLVFNFKSRSKYFWMGALSMFMVWMKTDNVFFPIFLSMYMLWNYVSSVQDKQEERKKEIAIFIFGLISVFFVWCIFVFTVGLNNVFYYMKYALMPNLNHAATATWYGSSLAKPFSAQLFWTNICNLSLQLPEFMGVVTALFAGFFCLRLILKKGNSLDPLALGIILCIFVLFGKSLVSCLFGPRRIAPLLPLPFLLFASVSYDSYLLLQNHFLNSIGNTLHTVRIRLMLIFIFFSISVCSILDIDHTINLIFRPSYAIKKNIAIINSLLNHHYKAIFLDGRFSYYALSIPMRFIDIPPNLNAKDFHDFETNHELLKKLLYEDKRIAYVFVRVDNINAIKIIRKAGGKLIVRKFENGTEDPFILGNIGLLYILPDRLENKMQSILDIKK